MSRIVLQLVFGFLMLGLANNLYASKTPAGSGAPTTSGSGSTGGSPQTSSGKKNALPVQKASADKKPASPVAEGSAGKAKLKSGSTSGKKEEKGTNESNLVGTPEGSPKKPNYHPKIRVPFNLDAASEQVDNNTTDKDESDNESAQSANSSSGSISKPKIKLNFKKASNEQKIFGYIQDGKKLTLSEKDEILKKYCKETNRYYVLNRFLDISKNIYVYEHIQNEFNRFKENPENTIDITGMSARARIILLREIIKKTIQDLPPFTNTDRKWNIRMFYLSYPIKFKIGRYNFTLNITPTKVQPGNGVLKPVGSYEDIIEILKSNKYKDNVEDYIKLMLIQKKYGDPIFTGNEQESEFLNGLNLLLDYEVARRLVNNDEYRDLPILVHMEYIIKNMANWQKAKEDDRNEKDDEASQQTPVQSVDKGNSASSSRKTAKGSSKEKPRGTPPVSKELNYLSLFETVNRYFDEYNIAGLNGACFTNDKKPSKTNIRRKLDIVHRYDEYSDDDYEDDVASVSILSNKLVKFYESEIKTFLEYFCLRYQQKIKLNESHDFKQFVDDKMLNKEANLSEKEKFFDDRKEKFEEVLTPVKNALCFATKTAERERFLNEIEDLQLREKTRGCAEKIKEATPGNGMSDEHRKAVQNIAEITVLKRDKNMLDGMDDVDKTSKSAFKDTLKKYEEILKPINAYIYDSISIAELEECFADINLKKFEDFFAKINGIKDESAFKKALEDLPDCDGLKKEAEFMADKIWKLKSDLAQSMASNVSSKTHNDKVDKYFKQILSFFATAKPIETESQVDKSDKPIDSSESQRIYGSFTIKEAGGGGNCFFHSVLDQLRKLKIDKQDDGNEHDHETLRQKAIDHLRRYRGLYQGFMIGNEDIADYIRRMERVGEFAEGAIIIAMSRALNVNLVIITDDELMPPIVFRRTNPRPTLYIYHQIRRQHYQSLVSTATPDDFLSNVEFDAWENTPSYTPQATTRNHTAEEHDGSQPLMVLIQQSKSSFSASLKGSK